VALLPLALTVAAAYVSVFLSSYEGMRRHLLCHPDEASNASGWKDLGQLRVSEAGTGF
jgi:hypothetical protein